MAFACAVLIPAPLPCVLYICRALFSAATSSLNQNLALSYVHSWSVGACQIHRSLQQTMSEQTSSQIVVRKAAGSTLADDLFASVPFFFGMR